jgi:hypothetical protein
MSTPSTPSTSSTSEALAVASTNLLRGVVYEEEKPEVWQAIKIAGAALHDTMAALGITVTVDEPDAMAYLRQSEDLADGAVRLMHRQRLTRNDSILLILLRQRLHAHEVEAGAGRLVVSTAELREMLTPHVPDSGGESRFANEISRLCELGYLRELKSGGHFEVRRIIKAQITADVVAQFRDAHRHATSGLISEQAPDFEATQVTALSHDGEQEWSV